MYFRSLPQYNLLHQIQINVLSTYLNNILEPEFSLTCSGLHKSSWKWVFSPVLDELSRAACKVHILTWIYNAKQCVLLMSKWRQIYWTHCSLAPLWYLFICHYAIQTKMPQILSRPAHRTLFLHHFPLQCLLLCIPSLRPSLLSQPCHSFFPCHGIGVLETLLLFLSSVGSLFRTLFLP